MALSHISFAIFLIETFSIYSAQSLNWKYQIHLLIFVKLRHNSKKVRCCRYLGEIITDEDCIDDSALLVNTPTEAESQSHGLKQEAKVISL